MGSDSQQGRTSPLERSPHSTLLSPGAIWPHRRERTVRRQRRGLDLQLFPLSHAALALPSKTPCQIKLRISTTSKNDRFLSQWEQLSLDPRCSEMCSKVLRI